MTVDIDTFINADSLEDLPQPYRAEQAAVQKWQALCCEEAKEVLHQQKSHNVKQLDCMSTTIGGITYRVYGVIHGWSGGPNQEYRKLVNDTLKSEKHILFEKVLGNLYATDSKVQIPDFWVLGRLVQMVLGFRLCLFFPWLIIVSVWDILLERFSRGKAAADEDEMLADIFNNIDYHKLPPEIRRGVGESLPTKLCIKAELGRWNSFRRYWDFETSLAVVARSAYMADFARKYATDSNASEIAIVVGDRHLTEVIYFLHQPLKNAKLQKAATHHGAIIARHSAYYYLLFAVYLITVGIGALGAMTIYFILYALYVLSTQPSAYP